MSVKVAVLNFNYSLNGVTEVLPNSAIIDPAPSSKTKINGKGVYRGTISLTFPTGTLAAPEFTFSETNTEPAVFTINPEKILKLKVDDKIALGVGDVSSVVMVTGLLIDGTAVLVPATVKISDAGQDKVTAE